jgi:hypothetical protein
VVQFGLAVGGSTLVLAGRLPFVPIPERIVDKSEIIYVADRKSVPTRFARFEKQFPNRSLAG